MKDLDVYSKKLNKVKAKQEYLNKLNKLTFGTYTKRLVAIIIGFCLINVELSYILAFLGKDPLVDVTNQLIITILGTVIVYIVRAFFDTWSENKYGDGNQLMEELDNKIDELQQESNKNIFDDSNAFIVNYATTESTTKCDKSEDMNNDDQYGN